MFPQGREEVVVGMFDPPTSTVTNDDGTQEEVRKINDDEKYKWWHKISHNAYNEGMSFVLTSKKDIAHCTLQLDTIF
jgi:hypothetical protein